MDNPLLMDVLIASVEQRAQAIAEGTIRQNDAVKKGYRDKWAFKVSKEAAAHASLMQHINGRGGEILTSVWLELPLGLASGAGHAADVGIDIQVRTTTYSDGCCLVRDRDPFNHFYVLLIGDLPNYRPVGWIHGQDVLKLPKKFHRTDLREVDWKIPQEYLFVIEDLPHYRAIYGPPDEGTDATEAYFDTFPMLTREQRAEMKRKFRKKVVDESRP